MLQVDDPWELKSMLSNMRFVVGSRFHGLVAALSNNVPVISIGWSHKYAELLSDFGLSDFLVTEQHSEEQVTELVDILSHENTNQLKRKIIAESFEKKKSINQQMWSKVTGILQSNQK